MTAKELLINYSGISSWDEMGKAESIREPYQQLLSAISSLSVEELLQKDVQAAELFMNQGITFTVYSDNAGIERIFPFDILPRIITGTEWHHIESGIKQRLKALNLFLKDIYNGQQIIKEHDFEFSQKLNDQTVYDIILKNTDPNLVIQQLDIGNLYNGGAKAIDIVRRYPGRFQSMHVKDEIQATSGNEKFESTLLGKGIVGVKEVIDLGKKSGGTIHFIIEQESYQGKSALETCKDNLAVMKSWGY